MPRHLGDFSLHRDLYEALRREAERRDESMSFIVREALRAYLNRTKEQGPVTPESRREGR